ncbi:MAG TPA: hypothetical protein VFJ62_10915, partial [Usitatibacter sp.]|nr:hypothetical protein [Usitatibacter sp.]
MTAGVDTAAASDAASVPGNPSPDETQSHEQRGWSGAAIACEAKIIALRALQDLRPPEPVPSVHYLSRGNVLVVAGDDAVAARAAAARLAGRLHVTLLERAWPQSALPGVTSWAGRVESAEGWLGEFNLQVCELQTAAGSARAASPTAAR